LTQDCETKQETIHSLQKSLVEVKLTISKLQSGQSSVEDHKQLMQTCIEEIKSKSTIEIKKLKEVCVDSKKAFNLLEQQKKAEEVQYKEEIRRLTQESEEKEESITSLHKSLVKAEARVKQVESNCLVEIKELKELHDNSKEAYHKLEQEKLSDEEHFEKEMQGIVQDSEVIQTSITSLRKSLEEADLINSKLKEENASVEEQNQYLQTHVEEIESTYTDEIKMLKETNRKSQNALIDLKQERTAGKVYYEEEIQRLTQDCEMKESRITSMKKTVSDIEEMNSKLKSALQVRVEEVDSSNTEEVKKMKEMLSITQQAVVGLEQERITLEEEIDRLNQDNEEKQKRISSLQKILAESKSTISRLKSAKISLLEGHNNNESPQQLQTVTHNLDEEKERNSQLKNQVEALKQELSLEEGLHEEQVEKLANDLLLQKENVTKKQVLIEQLQKALSEADAKQQQTEKIVENYESESSSQQESSDALPKSHQTVDELQEQAKDQKEKASLLHNEVADLKEKIETKKARVESFTAEIQGVMHYEEELQRLTQDGEAKQKDITSLRMSLNEAEKVVTFNTEQTKQKEREVMLLQKKVQKLSTEIEDLSQTEQELKQAKLLVVHKGYEIEKLEGQLKTEKIRVGELQEKVKDLTEELQDASETGGNLAQARVMIAKKEHRIQDLEHELKEQNQKIFYLQDQVNSLKEEIDDFEKTNGQLGLARSMLLKKSNRVEDLEDTNLKQRIKIVGLSDELKAVREQLEIKSDKVSSISKMKNRQLKELEDKLQEMKWVIREKDTTIQDLLELKKLEEQLQEKELIIREKDNTIKDLMQGTQQIKKEFDEVRTELENFVINEDPVLESRK